MHELSIAHAILERAVAHAPAGTVLKRVRVRAGPMRAIDPEALQFAWRGVIVDTMHGGCELTVALEPWRLVCGACGREWESEDLYVTCSCGSVRCRPVGGDELDLMSMDVEELAGPAGGRA